MLGWDGVGGGGGLDQWHSIGLRTESCLAWAAVVSLMWIEEPEP